MVKTTQSNKSLKLNDTDRKILVAYSDMLVESASKPTLEEKSDKDAIKLY